MPSPVPADHGTSRARAPFGLLLGSMMRAMIVTALASAALPVAVQAQAQAQASTVSDMVAEGNRESASRRTALAYSKYVAALALDARNYDALWRAAREAVDLGEIERDATKRAELYRHATDYARRAVAAMPNDAEGYFHLSRALGRTALNVGVRERVKYAIDVRTNALRALELRPRHPGASHVMGVWNAEVMRLNGIARGIAKAFLGGAVFGSASWSEALRYMEQAVTSEPNRLVHLLDLARVYRDMGRTADARATFTLALRAPDTDANDNVYRRAAEQELRALR